MALTRSSCVISFLCCLLCIASSNLFVHGAPSLLGACTLGGGSSEDCSSASLGGSHNTVDLGVHADGSSMLTGSALHVDIGLLTLAASGTPGASSSRDSVFTVTSTHAQYQDPEGNVLAMSASAGKLLLHHNDRPVFTFAPPSKAYPTLHRWLLGAGAVAAEDVLLTTEAAVNSVCSILRLTDSEAACPVSNSAAGNGISLQRALQGILAALTRMGNGTGAGAGAGGGGGNTAANAASPAAGGTGEGGGVSEARLRLLLDATESTLRGQIVSQLAPMGDRLDKAEQAVGVAAGKVLGDAREYVNKELKGLTLKINTMETLGVEAHNSQHEIHASTIQTMSVNIAKSVTDIQEMQKSLDAISSDTQEVVARALANAAVLQDVTVMKDDIGIISSAFGGLNTTLYVLYGHVDKLQTMQTDLSVELQASNEQATAINATVYANSAQTEQALSHMTTALNVTVTETHNDLLEIDSKMQSLQMQLNATVESTDARLGELGTTLETIQADVTNSTESVFVSISAVASNSSNALARSNSILTKAIGHMNATLSALQDDTHTKIAALGTDIAASAATTTSLIKTAEEGIRLDTAESIASLAINTTNAIQAMQNTIFTDVNAHSQALQEQVTAVNSTTAMQLVLLESSLAASLQDVSTEITLVTQQLQGEVTDAARNTTAALAQQKTDMLQQLQAFNATLLARWESQNKTVSSAIESLVVVVATQLDNLKQSAEVDAKATEAALSKLQESVAGSTSTLSERLSGVLGRASKLEEQTALLLQASSTTREKLALLDHSHTTHSEAVRERKTSADAQATTWNALHATYATQLQSLNSQITTLQKGLDKSEAALLAATGVANSLKETNINLTTRLEKMESTERKEEESVAALRERITRLETLVEVLMKK